MSLQIDPASVHLGKTAGGSVDNLYVANYVATNPATLPVSCTLPPEIPYTPGNPALLPLLPSCTFNFTDVLGIPPVPPPPSPYSFKGCETLTATTNIITTNATKNTSLSLIAKGPLLSADGVEDCSLQLVGIIDINACNDFTASSAITFSKAATGSTLAVTASGAPNCGVTLTGDINIAACENFTATSNIVYGNALRGSYLTLSPSSLPNCGLDISGAFNVNACESFSAASAVSFRGNAVTSSNFSITPTSTPNCGFTLVGDVQIDACTNFSASGGITFSGAAVKSSSVRVTAAQQPNCGLVLAGEVVIDACATFTAVNNLRISGSSVTEIAAITISSYSTPDCGFTLNGELRIDACASASVTIVPDNTNPSRITLYTDVPEGKSASSGRIFSTAQMLLRSAQLATGGSACDSLVSLSIDSIDLAVPGDCCPIVLPYTPGTMTGCCWNEDENGPFLYKDPFTDELYIAGNLPEPCFVCSTSGFTDSRGQVIPFVYADIKLNSLNVNFLTAPDCCASRSDNQINLCDGSIVFSDPATSSQLAATATTLNLTGLGVATNITPGDIVLIQPYKAAQLESGSLSLEDTSMSSTYLYATAQQLTYHDASSNSAGLTASFLKIKDRYNNYGYVYPSGFETANSAGSVSQVNPTYIASTNNVSLASMEPDTFTTHNSFTGTTFQATSNSLLLGVAGAYPQIYMSVNTHSGEASIKASDLSATRTIYAPYIQADEGFVSGDFQVDGNMTIGGRTYGTYTIVLCSKGGTQYQGTILVADLVAL